jgi:transcription initiation factor TFIIB
MKAQCEICEGCQAENTIIIDYENGEKVCSKCGMVKEDIIISNEYEKRTFQDDEGDGQIQRVSQPTKPGNEQGTNLLIRENGKTRYIRGHSKYGKIEKNFWKIENLLSSVGISKNTIEEVKTLYDKVNKNMSMQGRNISHIIIGIYHYAIRKQKQAKTLREVTEMFKGQFPHLTERIVKKAFNSIKRYIVETNDENDFNDMEKNYIETFINGNTEKYNNKILAYKIIENINKSGLLEGKNPKTIAGLSLLLSYKLLNDNFTDREEFYKMFSNRATLNRSYILIKNSINEIIPQEYKNIILNDFPGI